MRSRYAAYALGKISYVVQTWHPASPLVPSDKVSWRKGLKTFASQTTYVGLKIMAEGKHPDGETVTFHARLLQGADDLSFVEQSLFRRVKGRWYYFDRLNS